MNVLKEIVRLLLIILLCILVCALIMLVLSAISGERELQQDAHNFLGTATLAVVAMQEKVNAIDVEKLNQTISDTDATVGKLRKQIDQVDPRTLNTIALHVDKVVGHLDQATHDYVSNQRDVTDKTLQVLDSTDAALQEIRPVLSQARLDLLEANVTLKNTTETTANLSHTTQQIDHKVTELMKPMSLAKRILLGLSTVGAHVLSWFGALR